MKILPFPQKPMFLCYHNKAFPFGIIEANSPENIIKWMCTKSVNCVFNPNSPNNKFDFVIWDEWGVNEGLVTQQAINIKKDFIDLLNSDFLSVIKNFINKGCYVHGSYNEKYIPEKWAFGLENYMHDFLIIGCDEKKFISVGYVADGRFKQFEIPNQNLIDGLYETNGIKINLNFFSYNKDAVPVPNTRRMIDDLRNYISTINYSDNPTPQNNSYGISTNMRLRDFFENEVKSYGKLYVDKRYSRVLYEHKWVLMQLIDSFLDKDEKKEYKEIANKNMERAKLVHMLGLKMDYTGDSILIDRIVNLMNEIICNEVEYIPKLIKLLEKNYSSVN